MLAQNLADICLGIIFTVVYDDGDFDPFPSVVGHKVPSTQFPLVIHPITHIKLETKKSNGRSVLFSGGQPYVPDTV